jgi:hypothetical protein
MTTAPEDLERRDPRVDAFIAALPDWQQEICAQAWPMKHDDHSRTAVHAD